MSQGRSLHRPGGMNTPLLPVSAPAQSGATSSQYQYQRQRQRQRLHRLGARILGGFALLHLLNHLAALGGVAVHQQVLEVLRWLYRSPWVEPLLLLCVLAQVVSGSRAAWAAWRAPGRLGMVERIQVLSGLVLGSFLSIHVSAVLAGRWLQGLDTNFHFAAAGLHIAPFGWFFVPYYFAGVSALGIHLACALWWRLAHRPAAQRRRAVWAVALAGMACAAVLVALLAGWVVPVQVPAVYRASFGV